jgi:hypothetical protein
MLIPNFKLLEKSSSPSPVLTYEYRTDRYCRAKEENLKIFIMDVAR